MSASPHAESSPRAQLLALQRRLFAHNDALIKEQTHIVERDFVDYEKRYKRYVDSYERVISPETVFEAIEKADIIYLGDYHTNPQAQRTLLRILKRLQPRQNKIAVALELILKRHQGLLDQYLEGSLEEEGFLSKIHLEKYWYFDLWENFKPIFEFSKFHKIPIFGIERHIRNNVKLKKRDREMAREILGVLDKNPGIKLIVFVGDLHVAPPHLPREVEALLKKSRQKKTSLILYQNSEKIYWRLASKKLEEQAEVVKVNDSSYCFNNTPPIIWQQSFLNWLDAEGGEIDWTDAKHQFLDLTHQIATFFELPIPEDVDDIEVYTSGYLNFLERLKRDPDISLREWRLIKQQILSSESYFIPRKRMVYLGNVSINHVAEEASHYLKFLCSGQEFPRRLVDAFYANTLHEAVGFFGSKIINHKRKCMGPEQYRLHLQYLHSLARHTREQRRDEEISNAILEHCHLEKKSKLFSSQKVASLSHEIFWGVSHGLGYILGNRLYYAMVQNKVDKDKLREVYCEAMEEEGAPLEWYLKLLILTQGAKLPKRI